MKERELFLSALAIEDPRTRRAHLESACGDDPALLARVESLLASHESQSQFLNTPVMEQIADEPAAIVDDTIIHGDGSTQDDESAEVTLDSVRSGSVAKKSDGPDNETVLDYLKPPSGPDSWGRLAHYDVLEVIGRGAFGTVLKAFDEKLQRVVAIKVLAPEMAATSPARKRFLREARSSAAIRHENVVRIYAVEDDPIPYLVMEYIPGQTLQQRLNEYGPLDLRDVLRVGKQIADGLAAAHDQHLIHRDVKPGNVLLETNIEDHVKITDFGLARTADDASMTQSGMIAGTPMYMAPEQALGHRLDQRADLFSLGSVLYQMLSGRPPFRAPSTVAVLKRVTDDTPRPIQEIIPEVPDWMCRIVSHLHAKNPDDRYQSAQEVSDLLARCLLDLQESRKPRVVAPSSDRAIEPAQSIDAKRVSKKTLRKVAVVMLILLCGLGVAEAAGVTKLTSTIIRFTTGAGTLVIETDDANLKITVDGEEVTIRGDGIEELTLRPGKYTVAAARDGKQVNEEVVTITRNSRSVVRMSLEPNTLAVLPKAPVAGRDGWVQLFNGRDLSGWQTHPDQPGEWSVEDGVLTGRTALSNLFSERGDYRNFHIYLEAKINEGGDSGLFFRSEYGLGRSNPKGRRYPKAHEAQIIGGRPRGRPFLSGELYGFPPSSGPPTESDKWFAMEVVVNEKHVVTRVNGQVAVDIQDVGETYNEGHVALQCDVGAGTETIVQFRKVLIKELPGKSDRSESRIAGVHPKAETRALRSSQASNSHQAGQYALSFDGTAGTRVEIPTLGFRLQDAVTIEAFARVAGSKAMFVVGAPGLVHGILLGSEDGAFRFKCANRFAVDKSSTWRSDDGAVHIAGVYDGESTMLFVNGVMQGRNPNPISKEAHGIIRIGGQAGHSDVSPFNGVLSEVRVSDVARYQENFTPTAHLDQDEHTLALYHFDTGHGEVLVDSSGNGHHGTIVGARWVQADGTEIEPTPGKRPRDAGS